MTTPVASPGRYSTTGWLTRSLESLKLRSLFNTHPLQGFLACGVALVMILYLSFMNYPVAVHFIILLAYLLCVIGLVSFFFLSRPLIWNYENTRFLMITGAIALFFVLEASGLWIHISILGKGFDEWWFHKMVQPHKVLLDCELIEAGQSDIVGPGVRAAILFQTYASICFVQFAPDNTGLITVTLSTARAAKIVFLLTGFIQWTMGQVSFYHLVALSILSQLLTVLDYGEAMFAMLSPPPMRENPKVTARVFGVLAGIVHIAFMGPLLWLTLCFSLSRSPRFCLKFGTVYEYPTDYTLAWNQANLTILFVSIILEVLLIFRHLGILRFRPSQDNRTHRLDPFVLSVLFAGALTASLQSTVVWLLDVSNGVDAEWTTGQLIPLLTSAVATTWQVGEYLEAKVLGPIWVPCGRWIRPACSSCCCSHAFTWHWTILFEHRNVLNRMFPSADQFEMEERNALSTLGQTSTL